MAVEHPWLSEAPPALTGEGRVPWCQTAKRPSYTAPLILLLGLTLVWLRYPGRMALSFSAFGAAVAAGCAQTLHQ